MNAGPTVAVTGLGCVSAAGVGRSALASALANGELRTSDMDRSSGMYDELGARTAALVDSLEVARRLPALEARRMSPPGRYAVVAAREALDDAGLDVPAELDPALAIILATAFGPSSFTTRLMDQILDEGPAFVSPALFTECVANAAAARVAIACRAGAANLTIAQGEAGPLRSVARAAAEVAAGRARAALAGAVEEMTPLVHVVLDRFRALSRPSRGEPERARPFDRRRNGFLAAEGATLLVLENREDALRRGASVLALVRGSWSAFDPSAPASGFGVGDELLAQELVCGLERSGLSPEHIDVIVSGAAGGVGLDRLEASVLRRAWGDRPLPPVLAPKGLMGEYGGAFLGAAVLAATGAPFAATAGFEEVDPELAVRPHDGRPLGEARYFLVTSLAAGGAGSWLVLERP